MSWRDRSYSGDSSEPELRMQFRRPSSAVGWLITANAVVFLASELLARFGQVSLAEVFGLSLIGLRNFYFWQPLTYMFMHAGVWHVLINMLGLYIFGSEFERHFGTQRFLQFYATCGLIGGLAYLGLGSLSPGYAHIPLVGASGAVYGLLVAAIIFFPHIQVVLFIFPMPIRVFGLIVAAMLALQLINGGPFDNFGGQICHLAGASAGVAMFYAWGVMPRIRLGSGKVLGGRSSARSESPWERKQRELDEEQAEVDRVLDKVHRQGLKSLNRTERKALERATRRQQERERELHRVNLM